LGLLFLASLRQKLGATCAKLRAPIPVFSFEDRFMRLLIAAIALTAFAGAAAAEEAKDQTLPSGLIYRSLKEGSGASPKPSDVVKVHYRGTLQSNGKEFDSSYSRNQPLEFPLQGVIKCWTEGLQKMKVGGKARLVCPPQIAYGSRAMGDVIPANSTLVFEVELLDIRK
jgi:FKBP-type peptidyl-prolyl cis-trans isomerase FkpA